MIHQNDSLASALFRAFEKQAELLPANDATIRIPSAEGIRGVLQAVQDQTSSFDWRIILLAVASKLEAQDSEM